jgi:hypothetical protein
MFSSLIPGIVKCVNFRTGEEVLSKVGLPWLYYGLALSQALHSTEEVLTGLWRWMPQVTAIWHARLGWLPVLQGMGETYFAVANLVIVTGFMALMPFVFERRAWALILAFVIAVIEIVNGFWHLVATIIFRSYFPGLVAGVGLLVFGFLYIWNSWKTA